MKYYLLVAALFVYSLTNAQDESKNIIQLSGGVALPQGDFASTTSNDGPGSAKTGIQFGVSWQHSIRGAKGLWYSVQYRGQSFGFDQSSITNSGYTANSVSNWKTNSIMVGPVYSLQLGNSVFFEPRIMLGYFSANSPAMTISGSGITATMSSANGTALTNLFGANFRFDAGSAVSLFVNMDYQMAKVKFKIPVSASGSSQTVDANQAMNSLNIAFGIGFRL